MEVVVPVTRKRTAAAREGSEQEWRKVSRPEVRDGSWAGNM